jgi:hypothetical protein
VTKLVRHLLLLSCAAGLATTPVHGVTLEPARAAPVLQQPTLDTLEAQVADLKAAASRDAERLDDLRAELEPTGLPRAAVAAVCGALVPTAAVIGAVLLLVRRRRVARGGRRAADSEPADLARIDRQPPVECFPPAAAALPAARRATQANVPAPTIEPPVTRAAAPEAAAPPALHRQARMETSFEEMAQRRYHWDEAMETPLAAGDPASWATSAVATPLLRELPIAPAGASRSAIAWTTQPASTAATELPQIDFDFSGFDDLLPTRQPAQHGLLDVDLSQPAPLEDGS